MRLNHDKSQVSTDYAVIIEKSIPRYDEWFVVSSPFSVLFHLFFIP